MRGRHENAQWRLAVRGDADDRRRKDDDGCPTTSDAPAADKGNPVDGTAFCAFLATMAPRLAADGSAPGAEADFAIELANWIGEHPAQKPRTAKDLDDASQQTCPKSRTTVVTAMGASSFDEALG